MELISKQDLQTVTGGLTQGEVGGAIGGAIGAAIGGAVGGNLGAALGGGAGTLAGTAMGSSVGVAGQNGNENDNGGTSFGTSTCNTFGCDSGGGGGGGKVICTELCRNGIIEHDVWMADIRYSRENFSEQTMRGYHLWGIPYVKLMRKFPLFAKIAAYPTSWFAEDIAYRMGVRAKPNLKGWVLREILFRPICSVIGVFAKARDWQALWRNERTQAARS